VVWKKPQDNENICCDPSILFININKLWKKHVHNSTHQFRTGFEEFYTNWGKKKFVLNDILL